MWNGILSQKEKVFVGIPDVFLKYKVIFVNLEQKIGPLGSEVYDSLGKGDTNWRRSFYRPLLLKEEPRTKRRNQSFHHPITYTSPLPRK